MIFARSPLMLAVLAGTLALVDPVAAQSPPRPLAPRDLFQVRTIGDVRLAPDGKRIAFTVTGLPPDGSLDAFASSVRIVTADGGAERVVTRPGFAARSPEWSPDGRFLAYLAGPAWPNDLWIVPAAGGPARRITTSTTAVESFAWSPDGNRIAFVMADAPDSRVATRQRLVQLASDTAPPSRLWVVALDGDRRARAVTATPQSVSGTPSWSPDGTRIAVASSPSSLFLDRFSPSLAVIELRTGKVNALRHIGNGPGAPHFSPDGTWIAVIAADRPAKGPVPVGLYVVASDGGSERRLADADGYTSIAGWLPDGSGLLVSHQLGTRRELRRIRLDGSSTVDSYRGPVIASDLHPNADGTLVAFAGESLDSPPEVYLSSTRGALAPRTVTAINRAIALPSLGSTRLVSWKSPDGTTVDGLLTMPPAGKAQRPPPLLVVAHAGGETFTERYVANPTDGSGMVFPPAVFASRGYAVLRVNQRGGGLAGYGFDGGMPIFQPKRRAVPDILSGVDSLIRAGVVDGTRIAIMGWSNGALVTQSLITGTTRFAAAALLAGFPDLVQEAGLNPWMIADLGASPWERPEAYLAESPLFAIGKARTPTLIVHGDQDNIPTGEARAFHANLKAVGVETELAIYPGMGHVPATPRQMIDIAERALAWFDRHLGRGAAAR